MSNKAWLAIGFVLLGVGVTFHDGPWFSVVRATPPMPLLQTHWDGPILVGLGIGGLFWAMTRD